MSYDPKSYDPASNPYASPKPDDSAVWAGTPGKMEYLKAYNFVFAHPEWQTTLLNASLCMLIPILNQILWLGYTYEVVESLHRFPGKLYPRFDFNRFSPYVTRGIWPFLVAFIVGMVIQIPMQIVSQVTFAIAGQMAQQNQDAAPMIFGVVFSVIMILSMFVNVLMSMVTTPLLLRAGISQDFKQTFQMAWVKDFLTRTWLETLLVGLFVSITGGIICVGGFLLCCIGVIPAAVIVGLASANLQFQLYSLYLSRGGEAIPFKPAPSDPMMPPPKPVM